MKLVKFLSKPKSFNNLIREALNFFSDTTPLQMRHQLKESWESWVDIIEERDIYDSIDKIIVSEYLNDIYHISNIKPCDIKINSVSYKNDLEFIYDTLNEIVGDCESLTLNALMWATICHNSENKTRLDGYLNKVEQ